MTADRGAQRVFHVDELLDLAGHELVDGNAGSACDYAGNIVCGDRVVEEALSGL